MMFACWNSIEQIRYGGCNVNVGCGSWFVVGGSFVCWLACDFIARDSDACSNILYCYIMFGSENLVEYGLKGVLIVRIGNHVHA